MKSRCLRTVKNHCKASKIHSSRDMRLERKKIRKTDESVEICRKQAKRDKKPLWMVWKCHLQGFFVLYEANEN